MIKVGDIVRVKRDTVNKRLRVVTVQEPLVGVVKFLDDDSKSYFMYEHHLEVIDHHCHNWMKEGF